MSGVNLVVLIGKLGRDPETREFPSGGFVANLSIATSSKYNDKLTGEKKETTEWHRVVTYGKLAEIVSEYAKKGQDVYIKGSLKTRKWQNKDGVDQYTTEILASEFQIIGSAKSAEPRAANEVSKKPQEQSQASFSEDDDIPF